MAINDNYVVNFKTLSAAVSQGDAALVRCTDKKSGEDVIVIAAVFQDAEGMYNMVPFAKMFDGNPYDELDPPVTYEAVKLDDDEKKD